MEVKQKTMLDLVRETRDERLKAVRSSQFVRSYEADLRLGKAVSPPPCLIAVRDEKQQTLGGWLDGN